MTSCEKKEEENNFCLSLSDGVVELYKCNFYNLNCKTVRSYNKDNYNVAPILVSKLILYSSLFPLFPLAISYTTANYRFLLTRDSEREMESVSECEG